MEKAAHDRRYFVLRVRKGPAFAALTETGLRLFATFEQEFTLDEAGARPAPAFSMLAHRRRERDRLRREFDGEWRALTGDPFRFGLSHLVSGEMRNEHPDGAVWLTRP